MKPLILTAALFAATGSSAADVATPETLRVAPVEDIRAIVEANHARWRAALNAGDVDAALSTYSPDAVLMPPTDETLAGHEAIGAFLDAFAETGLQHNGVDLLEVRRAGDTVYAAGVWSARRATGAGRELIGGNIVTILERQADGSWKTRLQTWN